MEFKVTITEPGKPEKRSELSHHGIEVFFPKEAEALKDSACRGTRTIWHCEGGRKGEVLIEKVGGNN